MSSPAPLPVERGSLACVCESFVRSFSKPAPQPCRHPSDEECHGSKENECANGIRERYSEVGVLRVCHDREKTSARCYQCSNSCTTVSSIETYTSVRRGLSSRCALAVLNSWRT